MKITNYEKKMYVLKDKNDLVILTKVNRLESKKLSKQDREIVRLIKSQLKIKWRLPLIKYLDKLIKKYKS